MFKNSVSGGLCAALLATIPTLLEATEARSGFLPNEAPQIAAEVLTRQADANELLFVNLHSFVCDERVERFRGSGNSDGKTRHLDTLTAQVSFENGVEHYADVRQNTRVRPGFSSLAGAWSEGEFGTLLGQTRQLLRVERPKWTGNVELNGEAAAVFTFAVPEDDSPWELIIDGAQYRIPFQTDVWISVATGKILKVLRNASGLPAALGISHIEWSVMLQPVSVHEAKWLVPSEAEYSVSYTGLDRREWNQITFSNYRRYGSESNLRFDGAGQ